YECSVGKCVCIASLEIRQAQQAVEVSEIIR
ncbi:unnamed protein product, partial [marine sediment metagenome]